MKSQPYLDGRPSLEQPMHCDYDDSYEGVGALPGALEDDTKFVSWGGVGGRRFQHTLAAGDLLYFESDAVHAGAGYEKVNVRLHAGP